MAIDNNKLIRLVDSKDDQTLIQMKIRAIKRLNRLKAACLREEFFIRSINYARELIAEKEQIPLAFGTEYQNKSQRAPLKTLKIKDKGQKKRGRPRTI